MATAFKVKQSNPNATTLTELYAVPAATKSMLNTIVVANRSSTPTTFRISIQLANAADSNEQYIAYDTPIGGNQSIVMSQIGLPLDATDTVNVYATLATLSFNAGIVEIT